MDKAEGETKRTGAVRQALRYFRLHALAYAAAATILILADVAAPGGWRFFWPVFLWGLLVLLHFLYVKSLRIDSAWAEERAAEVAEKAYDIGHIEDIRQRYEGEDLSGRGGERGGG